MLRKLSFLIVFFTFVLFAVAVEAKPLVVYSTAEPELVAGYTKAFNKLHPEVELKWVCDSTGPITARLLAEKDAPQADIAFALSLNSILRLEGEGVFEPYKPSGLDGVAPKMRNDEETPLWQPLYAWALDLSLNKPEMEKKKLPMPKTWADLLNPAYKGLIVMPNPVSSGTGYMAMAAWIFKMGEEKAWDYMKQLNQNVRMYTHSGCKPAEMAAQGETAVGVSFYACAEPYLKRKAPVSLVEPEDGLGWDVCAGAILKGAKNTEDAKKLMDFALSPEATKLIVDLGYIPNRPDLATPEIKKTYDLLLPVDFKQDAAKRESRLQEWRERFEGGEGKAQ